MKGAAMKKHSIYIRWGLTVFLAGCALLIFYDVFYRDNSGTVQAFFEKLFSILAPILYGMGMAYLLAPIVNFLERNILRLRDALEKKRGKSIRVHKGWLRAAGIFLTWAFMLVLLYLLFAMLVPELVDSVTTLVNNLESYYKTTYDWVSGLLSDNPKLTELAGSFYNEASQWLTTKLLPGLQTAVTNFTGFVRGKLLDSLIIGILCFIGCSILKMPYTPLVSVIVGVTNVIPFFGPFLGAIPCALLILLVSPLKCLYFVIFIFLLQQLDGNVIGPKILGDSTGISSIWVIVAILIGGGFGGVLGMFLGVPIFACLQVLVRWLLNTRLKKKNMPLAASEYLHRDQQAPPSQSEKKTDNDK